MFIFIYFLKGRVRERDVFPLADSLPKYAQGWARPKPGTRDSIKSGTRLERPK